MHKVTKSQVAKMGFLVTWAFFSFFIKDQMKLRTCYICGRGKRKPLENPPADFTFQAAHWYNGAPPRLIRGLYIDTILQDACPEIYGSTCYSATRSKCESSQDISSPFWLRFQFCPLSYRWSMRTLDASQSCWRRSSSVSRLDRSPQMTFSVTSARPEKEARLFFSNRRSWMPSD